MYTYVKKLMSFLEDLDQNGAGTYNLFQLKFR
jgi:hypothetical protein